MRLPESRQHSATVMAEGARTVDRILRELSPSNATPSLVLLACFLPAGLPFLPVARRASLNRLFPRGGVPDFWGVCGALPRYRINEGNDQF
ncbi:hypothetical protein RvY_05657 [Ramazzottius varieornatus]|uniref:Uncharacterized protein n=1 Tax=Ramazzottius varieornatus TaxID=947166 RepID=A0A1D1UYU7_RAMVA|nr:hypothetical protein RvY_05657 [Ramazzottius varieornatus]